VFDTGDVDVFSFDAVAGTRYGFEARGFFSATDTRLELLGPGGEALGSSSDVDPGVRNARIDFYAGTTDTYYVRVTHEGTLTDWGVYDLLAFERPVSAVLVPPASITAAADNGSDAADPVLVQWLNAGAYDSVRVYRDGVLLAELPGAPSSYDDAADRGLYFYEVSGVLGGEETSRVGGHEFAGLIGCEASDDFESGTADQWITGGSNWGVTPFAESGTWGFTDSPAGTYQGCPAGAGGCTVNAVAHFGVPALLPYVSVLEFDHICITEDDFDYGIVEVSDDDGASWTEIARYDQGDDPGWGDNVADPTDWRHVSLDLSAFGGKEVQIRFRLQSDQLLELDGWYVDNVAVNDDMCVPLAVGGPEPGLAGLRLLAPSPNPMASAAVLAFVLPDARKDVTISVFDVGGRLVRHRDLGPLPAGQHRWTWNGADGTGRRVASGIYYARLAAGSGERTQKLVKISR
jgi:hypothetical protein